MQSSLLCVCIHVPAMGYTITCGVCVCFVFTRCLPCVMTAVCPGGSFAWLSIPEGTVQCVAQLYHCWQHTVYVERVRGAELRGRCVCVWVGGGYSSQCSLSWPPMHSSLLCVLLRQSHPSHLPVHRNTLLVGAKYIYQARHCVNI